MLSKCRCPHTGVVNFYAKADPLFAIGSVVEAGSASRYAWHCYIGDETGGMAPDILQAEAQLLHAIAGRQRLMGIAAANLSSHWVGYRRGTRCDDRKRAC